MPRPSFSSSNRHGLHEQKESAVFRAQQLTAVPSDLLTLKNLVRVDLSMNQLTRFPGNLVAAELLRLEVLLLQTNLLYVIEDILALSSAPRLRELDLRHNPLRLQSNRVYLLEALLGQPGADEDLLDMMSKDEQLRLCDRTSNSEDGGVSLHQRQPTAMMYCKKLPRKNGFPVLMRLNDEWISDREIRDVEVERGHAIEYYRPLASQVRSTRADSHGTASTSTKRGAKNRPKSAASDPASYTGRRFDGSRMTIKQMLRNESRSASIPAARVIHRFQIDADTENEIGGVDENDADRDDAPHVNTTLHWSNDGGAESASCLDDSYIASVKENESGDVNQTLGSKAEEQMIIRRLFWRASAAGEVQPRHRNMSTEPLDVNLADTGGANTKCSTDGVDVVDGEDEPSEPWNYSISTFDTLGSEDRQYVRAKSKQSGSTLERDDHFFASSIFLDCVAQAERSRRLTVQAVDLLSQHICTDDSEVEDTVSLVHEHMSESQSMPSLPTCTAAATLVQTMNAKFTKQLDQEAFEKVRAFQERHLSVDALNIQAAVGDYYQSEHMLQKQRNNQLLSAAQTAKRNLRSQWQQQQHLKGERSTARQAATADANIEDSLSKLKLRNAVDLANTLLDPKQQKRMLQQLIDADEKVIEEERIAQEKTAHKVRLELINARRYTPHDTKQVDKLVRKKNIKSASPWQRRNWKAEKEQRQRQETAQQFQSTADLKPPPNAKSATCLTRAITNQATGLAVKRTPSNNNRSTSVAPRFRDIETVERAAQDTLTGVNSHDLLVRCSEIRQHADKHAAELAQYRDRFMEDEAAWERMRQDPTNLVRKHLARRLYEHAQEVQIGSTQIFYSSLFNSA